MSPTGDPHTRPNLHPNPPPPKHRARKMPRKKNNKSATGNESTALPPGPAPGAMGPPPIPAKALQPDKFRKDRIQDMIESTDPDIQRKGRDALNTKFVEHLPKVIAASERLQTMLDIQNPTDWPLPTVRENLEMLIDSNVEILHTALDDCKDFALPMDRSSDKGELLDELHVKLHKNNVGVGGASFSAKAYPTVSARGTVAVSSSTQLLRTATMNAALDQKQTKTQIQTTTRTDTKNEIPSNENLADNPRLQETLATSSLNEIVLSPEKGETSPDPELASNSPPSVAEADAEPATPPAALWRGDSPVYKGTSVEAFSIGKDREIIRPLDPSLTNPDPLWTAQSESVSDDITASQIACQRHENYDANCLGCTRDVMHGLTTATPEMSSAAFSDLDMIDSPEITGNEDFEELAAEVRGRRANGENVRLVNTGQGFVVMPDEVYEDAMAALSSASDLTSPGQESADSSPFTGVALSSGSPDQDLPDSPSSASQIAQNISSEWPVVADLNDHNAPALEASPMAYEASQVTHARMILPIIQKSSHGLGVFSPQAPPTERDPVDNIPKTTTVIDPSIGQSEFKNKGKATSTATEPTQERAATSTTDASKGLNATGSTKKGRNRAVPDPTHPSLKDTLTKGMLNWDNFGSKAALTLTLEDTTLEMTSPKTPQIKLLHHFEVGLDGVEAICSGQFEVLQTPEVKADREARLGKLGTRKRGDGGMSGALKHAQINNWYGKGIWVYFGIRFKQTRTEKKLKKGGKWICLGAPYDAILYDHVPARQGTQMMTLGGGKDRDGNDFEKLRTNVQRTRMVISKGGVGPIDFWTSSGPWVDEAGLFYATRAAMANSGLRITFMFVDPLSPPMVFKPFTPKGPVAKSQGKRKEPAKEFTAEEAEKMEREKTKFSDTIVNMVTEQTKAKAQQGAEEE